jgi:N,N-dimethylformamidase beta subunit-like, C-terminal
VGPPSTCILLVALSCAGAASHGGADPDGRDTRLPPTNRPTVEAAFPRESYAPGDVARLEVWTHGSGVGLQVFRAGAETENVRARDVMLGTPVSDLRPIGRVAHGDTIRVPIGDWPSGLYFARLSARGDKVGYAPFVLRPSCPGLAHVAVVFSTMTWQAYNFHDDDRNGTLDTWYAGAKHARLAARSRTAASSRTTSTTSSRSCAGWSQADGPSTTSPMPTWMHHPRRERVWHGATG